jgi:hypothetical protein
MRVTECEARHSFVRKIRDAAAKTVVRIENEERLKQPEVDATTN